eukprot:gene25019-32603_t
MDLGLQQQLKTAVVFTSLAVGPLDAWQAFFSKPQVHIICFPLLSQGSATALLKDYMRLPSDAACSSNPLLVDFALKQAQIVSITSSWSSFLHALAIDFRENYLNSAFRYYGYKWGRQIYHHFPVPDRVPSVSSYLFLAAREFPLLLEGQRVSYNNCTTLQHGLGVVNWIHLSPVCLLARAAAAILALFGSAMAIQDNDGPLPPQPWHGELEPSNPNPEIISKMQINYDRLMEEEIGVFIACFPNFSTRSPAGSVEWITWTDK